jgi:catechol 2,3-dioxygenase-like lactoylglutathione lyase family enzyme
LPDAAVECHTRGMLGRVHHVVIDTADPAGLAEFYSQVLGLPITYRSEDWVVVADDQTSSGLAFQLAPKNLAPSWPDPRVPQQMHLDVMVDDPVAAGAAVELLGGRRSDSSENVFFDLSGHPFCLISRPNWAAPLKSPPAISAEPPVARSAPSPTVAAGHSPQSTGRDRV